MLREAYLERLDVLDQRLDELDQELDAYTDEQLLESPSPGVWSPAQLLCHMSLAERLSLAYVQKKLSYDPKLPSSSLSSSARCSLMRLSLASPIKIKAPKGVGQDSFPEVISANAMLEKWKQSRSKLREYLLELDDKWLDKLVYKHPFAGRLTFGQMLEFFEAHRKRHTNQLRSRLPK